jgi:hypothetical protein
MLLSKKALQIYMSTIAIDCGYFIIPFPILGRIKSFKYIEGEEAKWHSFD